MKANKPASILLATLLGAACWGASAAEMQEIEEVTTDGNTVTKTEVTTDGNTVTKTDITQTSIAPGERAEVPPAELVPAESGSLISAIGNRRDQLEKLINEEVSKGHLSQAQGSSLLAPIQAQKEKSTTVTTKSVTTYQLLPMASDLDAVTVRLHTLSPSVVAPSPLIVENRIYISDTKYVDMNDLLIRRLGLESKISKALLYGQLSTRQANDLRAQLDQTGAAEADMRAAHSGTLTDKEAKELYTSYDNVGSTLDHLIRSSHIKVDD